MHEIQLLYVENSITRRKGTITQTLVFFILVENLSYDKQVEVIWAREDGIWQTLTAHYHGAGGQHKEYWRAEFQQTVPASQALRDQVSAAVRLQSNGQSYWDNHHGLNYVSEANSGIKLVSGLPLLNIPFTDSLKDTPAFFPISVAVDAQLEVEQVLVHWTTDNWRHTHVTPCHPRKPTSPKPSHASVNSLWKARLKVKGAFRLQYCIACVAGGQIYWDNNIGYNYRAQHSPLRVMILNLHCYQEDHQDDKLSRIALAINETDADIVCLQEVAEYWNNGAGDWPSNAARIINERLAAPYHLFTDWSHLGFEQYREGVAILSRYPLLQQEARYVSDSQDIYSIHSRKVVMAQIQIPGIGLANVFSVHLSWWEDGFAGQFKRLSAWAEEKHTPTIQATLLCGDFNITAGSNGYDLVVRLKEYEDQFLAANAQGVFDKIFKVNDPHWQHYLTDDYRIDYIFMDKASSLIATSAKVIFTEADYGRVSDHCGYLLTFEPK